ncbi:MAG: PQQ-binding-like beta-propeller repeat protein [Verrucomicrobiota bacterium]
MKRLLACFLLIFPFASRGGETDWAEFRGQGSEASLTGKLPVEWSDQNGIAWQTDLSGFGQSSPVVYGGTVWVTSTAGDRKESLIVEGFDLKSGERTTHFETSTKETVEEVTKMISQGAPTPVVDELGLYAFFESGDLIALSPTGEERWRRSLVEEFGPFIGGHGIGSSLTQNDEHLFVLVDHDGPSYLLAVNKSDGNTAWKTDREPRVSWTSPLYFEEGGKSFLAISSNGQLAVYKATSGEMLASIDGLEGNNVPSPTWTGASFLIGSSAPQQSRAVSMTLSDDGSVELKDAWKVGSVTSSFASPIAFRGMGFFVNRAGVLQSVSLENGETRWETRLPASTWASPLVAGDHLYFFCQNGTTVILSPTLEGPGNPIAENVLVRSEEDRLYGIAAVEETIVLRFGSELIAVGGN